MTELPRAYIVPKGGLDAVPSDKRKDYAADVAKWVEERVANHKQLRGGVVLVDGIPKSPSGNVLRERLRMVARGELELNEVTSQGKQMQRNLVAGEREEGRSEDSQAREEATGREEAYL